jgi:hypothetical protein
MDCRRAEVEITMISVWGAATTLRSKGMFFAVSPLLPPTAFVLPGPDSARRIRLSAQPDYDGSQGGEMLAITIAERFRGVYLTLSDPMTKVKYLCSNARTVPRRLK